MLSALLFFWCLKTNAMAMICTANIMTFTIVQPSTRVIVLLMSSVSRNTMMPAMPMASATASQRLRCWLFCFWFSLLLGWLSLLLGWVVFFCFFLCCSSTQMPIAMASMRPAMLSIKFTRAQVCIGSSLIPLGGGVIVGGDVV